MSNNYFHDDQKLGLTGLLTVKMKSSQFEYLNSLIPFSLWITFLINLKRKIILLLIDQCYFLVWIDYDQTHQKQ